MAEFWHVWREGERGGVTQGGDYTEVNLRCIPAGPVHQDSSASIHGGTSVIGLQGRLLELTLHAGTFRIKSSF